MNKQKALIIGFILILLTAGGIIFYLNQDKDIQLATDTTITIEDSEVIVSADDMQNFFDDLDEISEEIYTENDTENSEEPENPEDSSNETLYNLEKEIEKHVVITMDQKAKKNSPSVTCKVEAPDLYSFLSESEEFLMDLTDEELYEAIFSYIENENSPKMESEIELPLSYNGKYVIADNTIFEYQDAIHGGLNSYLTELYVKSIEELNSEGGN